SGYQLETVSLKSDGDTELPGILAVPDRAGAKPAVLMMSSQSPPPDSIEELVKGNRLVLFLQPRPAPVGTESIKSPYLGVFNLLSLRAFLVGKTILGLRVADAIRALDVLESRKDFDRKAITAYGTGPMGMVLLHTAVLDSRISRLVLEDTLASYRMVVDQPVHRNVSEVVVPGILLHYDTSDLLDAAAPKKIVLVSPRDALGEPVTEAAYRAAVTPRHAQIRFEASALGAIAEEN